MSESGCVTSVNASNLSIQGNLIVSGETTTINTTNTTIKDTLIELNSGLTGANENDSGILIERGTTGNNAFMGWDESADSFILGTTENVATDTGNLTVAVAPLSCGDINANATTSSTNKDTGCIIAAGGVGIEENCHVGGTLNATGGVQSAAVARTATDDGTGTGTIAAGTSVVLVDADSDANHIIILPAPVVGNIITLIETSTTGYELRTSAPDSIAINGGSGANAESAIAGAVTYVKCVCVSSTSWICSQYAANGIESALEAAA